MNRRPKTNRWIE